jgi:hypothetical protein
MTDNAPTCPRCSCPMVPLWCLAPDQPDEREHTLLGRMCPQCFLPFV